MRCVTLYQPFATMIALGVKTFETRAWRTFHRGPLAIHAAKKVPANLRCHLGESHFQRFFEKYGLTVEQLPTGCVICTVTLHRCMVTDGQTPKTVGANNWNFGDWRPSRFAWELRDVKRFEPIPAGGTQGLWDWAAPAELEKATNLSVDDYLQFMRDRMIAKGAML